VIVTGGARGIGGEIAARFRADGANVAILDLLEDPGAAHAESLGASFHPVDLADAEAARAATSAAIERLGGVDVLVNSAGILRKAPMLEIGLENWDATFDINARATFLTMQLAASRMIEQGTGGRIVNIASMAAKTGGALEAHYAASKAAVVALTRVAAIEWGVHNITVNCLCPGYVLTPMGADTRTDADVAEWSSYAALGRLGEPSDVAGVAAFLASSDASYLTGQAINVCGGMVFH
jgi:3-oxoacyl-[acyl-carrier protein] reductase